jgi:Domain of unknown function (DUF4296)
MRHIILLLLLLCAFSCRNKKTDYIIPKDKFKEILIKLELVDSYYNMNYNRLSNLKDTNYYNEAIAKYGYNRAQFDSTFKYYTRNPKKFDALSDELINDLQKMEQELYVLNSFETDSASNLYKGKQRWKLPREGIITKIPFSVAIKDTGNYTINVRLRLLPKDHAKKPRLTAYFWYNDGTKEGHSEFFPEIPYQKTSELTLYKTSKRLKNKKVKFIKGWILNYDYNKGSYRFAEVKNIFIKKGD